MISKFNIEECLVQVIEELYKSSMKAVLLDNQMRDYFHTTVSINRPPDHLCCSTFSLENVVPETLDDHHTSIPAIRLTVQTHM